MEVQVSKGFVVLAQNNKNVDYVKQAYALALSIKATQQNVANISLVTNNRVPKEYKSVFDKIIPIPYNDDAKKTQWKIENRWKLYHASPYYETIVLDADMLLLEDIGLWWDYCSNFDMRFCSKITNYKLEQVIDTVHRKTFIANSLPNVYHALHYFKKSETVSEFYKILEFVVNNWASCFGKIAPDAYQNWLSMDLACAVAIEIAGLQDIIDSNSPLQFTHMKSPIQGWTVNSESWQDMVPHYLTSAGNLMVGNIAQGKLFHYVEKNFITDTLITDLEELASGKS
jgi:hypothetical protein